MSKANEQLLAALHKAVTDEFIRRIQSKEASASDMKNAIEFLKNNGITCDPSPADSASILDEAEDNLGLPFKDVVTNHLQGMQ